jgi:hypothetical protein
LGWAEGFGFLILAALAIIIAAGIVILLPIGALFLGGNVLFRMGSLVWVWWTGRFFFYSVRGVVAWYKTLRQREVVTTTVVPIDLTRYRAIAQELPVDRRRRVDWGKSYLCFQNSIDIAKVAGSESATQSLIVGLPVLALCTPAELAALANRAIGFRLEPISPMHLWLERINRGTLERLVWLHRQQSESTLNIALALLEWVTRRGRTRLSQFADDYARSRGERTYESALARMNLLQKHWELFVRQQLQPVLDLGGLPPIAAGLEQYVRRRNPELVGDQAACYGFIEGTWVNERRLCVAILPAELTENLRLIAWEDAVNSLGPAFWLRETQRAHAEIEAKRVRDLPALVGDWSRRSLAFLGDDARGLMPDVRRERVVWLLGAVFARALRAVNWQAGSADL